MPPLRNRMYYALKMNHSLSVFEASEGQPNIRNLHRKRVSVASANGVEWVGGGGELLFVEHFWRYLVNLGSRFWRPLDLGESIRLVFLYLFGATAKDRKSETLVYKYTAKVGVAK